jgi:hypothetical protein
MEQDKSPAGEEKNYTSIRIIKNPAWELFFVVG